MGRQKTVPETHNLQFFFIGILSIEITIAVARLYIGEQLQYDFILLLAVTSIAIAIFLAEGVVSASVKSRRSTKPTVT